jgi:hypothetical protein
MGSKAVYDWCERGDLNPHGFPRQILSLVRLPIPPLSRIHEGDPYPARSTNTQWLHTPADRKFTPSSSVNRDHRGAAQSGWD